MKKLFLLSMAVLVMAMLVSCGNRGEGLELSVEQITAMIASGATPELSERILADCMNSIVSPVEGGEKWWTTEREKSLMVLLSNMNSLSDVEREKVFPIVLGLEDEYNRYGWERYDDMLALVCSGSTSHIVQDAAWRYLMYRRTSPRCDVQPLVTIARSDSPYSDLAWDVIDHRVGNFTSFAAEAMFEAMIALLADPLPAHRLERGMVTCSTLFAGADQIVKQGYMDRFTAMLCQNYDEPGKPHFSREVKYRIGTFVAQHLNWEKLYGMWNCDFVYQYFPQDILRSLQESWLNTEGSAIHLNLAFDGMNDSIRHTAFELAIPKLMFPRAAGWFSSLFSKWEAGEITAVAPTVLQQVADADSVFRRRMYIALGLNCPDSSIQKVCWLRLMEISTFETLQRDVTDLEEDYNTFKVRNCWFLDQLVHELRNTNFTPSRVTVFRQLFSDRDNLGNLPLELLQETLPLIGPSWTIIEAGRQGLRLPELDEIVWSDYIEPHIKRVDRQQMNAILLDIAVNSSSAEVREEALERLEDPTQIDLCRLICDAPPDVTEWASRELSNSL